MYAYRIECTECNHPVQSATRQYWTNYLCHNLTQNTIRWAKQLIHFFFLLSSFHHISNGVFRLLFLFFLSIELTDMERCTDNRSTTPPLNPKLFEPKLRENGKQIVSSLYDKDDEHDISRTPITNDTLHVSTTPHSSKLRCVNCLIMICFAKLDLILSKIYQFLAFCDTQIANELNFGIMECDFIIWICYFVAIF